MPLLHCLKALIYEICNSCLAFIPLADIIFHTLLELQKVAILNQRKDADLPVKNDLPSQEIHKLQLFVRGLTVMPVLFPYVNRLLFKRNCYLTC